MASSKPHERKLMFIVINDGKTRGLEVMEDKYVWEVINMIERQIGGVVHKLFVARRPDMTWQRVTEADVIRMEEQKPVAFVKELMTRENEMFPPRPLSAYDFPSPDRVGAGDMHILVVKPGHIPVEPVWKDIAPLTPNLEDGILSFVNRSAAVKKLQKVQHSNFVAAQNDGIRHSWQIPLVDNPPGSGKSHFGLEYINECKRMLGQYATTTDEGLQTPQCQIEHRRPTRRDFLEQVCKCRTVIIRGSPGEFVGDQSKPPTALVHSALAEAIRDMLEPGTMSCLTVTDSAWRFATELVQALGSLFVVLDDVLQCFEAPSQWIDPSRGDTESRARFTRFCEDVLATWAQIPQLQFVVLGYGRYLQVEREGSVLDDFSRDRFTIVRLPLMFMRPNAIKQILLKTQVTSTDTKKLSDRWGLTSEESLQNAASLLFTASVGHPQQIVAMLRKHSSFDDFSACVNAGGDYHIGLAQIDALYRRVLLWQSTLRKWIGWDGVKTSTSPPRVNLLKVVTDINGEEEVATTVLYQCYLTWEGTLDNAHISAHRVIVDTIAGVLRPFREYVGGLARAMPFVTPQRREVFHWMCFKRLSELFSLESSLRGALPLFFVNTEAFDAFSGARLAPCVEMLPSSDDDVDYEPNTEAMDSESTHHTEWPMWFRRLHLELDNLTDKQVVCLKSLQPSLAPDVYVLMRVYYASEQNKLGEKRIPKIDMLVVGLAAINQTIPVSDARIHRECLNFEKVISNLDELTEAVDTVTNVLLVCATAYTEDLLGDFAGKASVSFNPEAYDCGRINEVLALNLAPQAWRKQFFGVGDDELLENSVELIVSRSKEN